MSARIRKSISILALLGLVLGAIPAVAQDITGSIVGIVKDANGAVVAGATATIKNTDKNTVARTVNTNEEGLYSAPYLPAGHYSVSIEATGFKKFVKTDIELNVNARIAVDAMLEAGAVSEEIVVSAGAVQIETQTATAAGLVSGIEMRELPINNRNFVQLTTLMPGVSSNLSDQQYIGTTNPSGQTNTVNISINGARSSQNNWTVDGADNVDRGSNLTLLNYPSVDAIAEFKVLRNHYSAEYGRNAAGHVNVITKSGSSAFHGGAYEFFRNDKLNANTFLNNANGRFTTDTTAKAPDLIVPAGDPRAGKQRLTKPLLRYNNFGYTIGGPVYIPGAYNKDKSKTFFFWSQEFRRVITYANFNATAATAAERQGIFATPVCVQLNAAGTACTQTATSIANINPAAAAYLKDIYSKVPLPQTGNTLVSNVKNIFDHRQELLRLDHNFTERFTLSVRYLHDKIPTEEPGGLFTGNVLPGVATTKTDSPGYSWVFRSVQTLSPTMTNEAGYSFSYGAIISDPIGLNSAAASPNVVAAVKLPFKPSLARIPGITPGFSGVSGFGPYDDFNRNHHVYDNFTKNLGRHTLKFGASFHHYQKTENAAGNNVGSFAFASTGVPTGTSATVQQWANFLLGNVSTFTQVSDDIFPDVRAKTWEFYVQDDFRFKSNLTVNMGLRYSMFRQPYDVSGRLTNFNPASYDPAKAVPINATTGNVIPGTGDPLNGVIIADANSPFGNKIAREDMSDFAPVIGFAWDPWKNGKTSVRGGYGLSYDTVLYGIIEQNIFANPPYVNSISISATRLDDPGSAVPTISAAPKNIRGTPFDYDTPYIQQWSMDVQREVMKNFIVDVGYFGSKGTHLLGFNDLNLVPPGEAIKAGIQVAGQPVVAGAQTNRLNAIRPFKGYISINAPQTWFNSNYHSLQVASEKRWRDGSVFRLAYTWSKALTDNQTDRSTAPQNFYNRALDYGPAQFDRRNILTMSYVYQIPFFKNQAGFTGRVLGGWQMSGIVSLASGLPLTVTTANLDPAGLGFLGPSASGPRPDVIRNPSLAGLRTPSRWFDTTAFIEVPVGENRTGSSPRGVVFGPGYQRFDLTLAKRFKIREGVSIQLRGEMYNALNHTNPSGVQTLRTSTQFGQVTSFRDPRTATIGLKLNF